MASKKLKQKQPGGKNDGNAVVPHPLYGNRSMASGYSFSEEEIRGDFWGYESDEEIFADSSIPADISRQSHSCVARKFYVDILKRCRECGRQFYFFALEQKYWYEDLQFNLSSQCIRCPGCRRSDRHLRHRFKRYSESVARDDLDDQELAIMIEDAVFLFRAGMIHRTDRLRQLRNVALRRIPNSSAVQAINEAISEL